MRRLPITLTGLVLIAGLTGLAGPAWADTGHGQRRFRSASNDAPGEGRSHYDRKHHDDDSVLF